MKKIFTSALAAVMLFAFGCTKQREECKISAEDFANATSENAAMFFAYSADKDLIKKTIEQKGCKEFLEELAKNKTVQEHLNKFLQSFAKETGKNIITPKLVNKAIIECANLKDEIFIGASIENFLENKGFRLLVSSPAAAEIFKEFAEEAKLNLQKFQKDGASIYKTDKIAFIVKNGSIVIAETEEAAEALIKNLKTPLEKSFAKTETFAKLASIKENANILCFIAAKEEEKSLAEIFASAKYSSPVEGDAVFKIELGKDADSEIKDAFKIFGKRTLPKGSLLKNSIKDSSAALAATIPELTEEMSEFITKQIGADNPSSAAMPLQMLKAAGLKNLYLSCGDLKAEQILKIRETMQPPEMFLKIDCENSDAFFKNPMVAPMLNSPFISQMQVGEISIYATMANIKFAPSGKSGAFVSTITDLAKTISLSNNSGESLADNKDAEHLFNRLPSGNQIEFFCDGKKLEDLAKSLNDMQMSQIREKSGESMDGAANAANAINEFSRDITKKSQIAMSLKIEEMSATINVAFVQEIDFEKAVKILKELK